MVRLSKRLTALCALVTAGGVLADIGTDHAYVPIALVQQKKIERAIALDIRKGPLSRALEHIRQEGLEAYITTRLSDGTAALSVHEADSILIAGMGGELMLHILTEGQQVCAAAQELILQPQSEIHKVRAYLRTHRYKIEDEDMICEGGKYYPMLRAAYSGQDDGAWSRLDPLSVEVCDRYGPLLLKNGNPVLRRFLVRQHRQLLDLQRTLAAQEPSAQIARRAEEVRQKLVQNEAAYTIIGEIRHAGI